MIVAHAFPLHGLTPPAVRRVSFAFLANMGIDLVRLVAAAEAAGDEELATLLLKTAAEIARARSELRT